jgi:phosphoribosylpyrophosphate synthetase
MLTGVIFDYSVLFNDANNAQQVNEIREMLEKIQAAGLKIAVFSTHNFDIDERLSDFFYPEIDLFLTRQIVKKNKGNKEWVLKVCEEWECSPQNLVYIGDDRWQYLAARHSGTLYINADWIHHHLDGDDWYPAFSALEPSSIWRFLTHYLLTEPRWQYSIDGKNSDIHIRSLLYARTKLPASNIPEFTLLDLFTYERTDIEIGGKPALNVLMNHAITSLYLEGLIDSNSVYCIYPSSTPDKVNPIMDAFVQPASRVFHGYPRDILQRMEPTVNTSLARTRGEKVHFTYQSNTVRLNPEQRKMIKGKSVIVLDDFTTTGMSLEWARHLLVQGGARRIILLTVGKYPKGGGNTHRAYTLPIENFSPFELQNFSEDDCDFQDVRFNSNSNAPRIIKASLEHLKNSEELPPEYWDKNR